MIFCIDYFFSTAVSSLVYLIPPALLCCEASRWIDRWLYRAYVNTLQRQHLDQQWNLALKLYTHQVKISLSSSKLKPVSPHVVFFLQTLCLFPEIFEPSVHGVLDHAPGIFRTSDRAFVGHELPVQVQLMGHLLAKGCTRVEHLSIYESTEKWKSALLKNETLFSLKSEDLTPLANHHPHKSVFVPNLGRPTDWLYRRHSPRVYWVLFNIQMVKDISMSLHGLFFFW